MINLTGYILMKVYTISSKKIHDFHKSLNFMVISNKCFVLSELLSIYFNYILNLHFNNKFDTFYFFV